MDSTGGRKARLCGEVEYSDEVVLEGHQALARWSRFLFFARTKRLIPFFVLTHRRQHGREFHIPPYLVYSVA
jgi:hypothetical protein